MGHNTTSTMKLSVRVTEISLRGGMTGTKNLIKKGLPYTSPLGIDRTPNMFGFGRTEHGRTEQFGSVLKSQCSAELRGR